MNVAIIDDDKTLAKALSVYLAARSFNTKIYYSYSQTEREFLQNTDVAVIDINLGDGNGLEIISKLKSKNNKLKVIIITGYDSLPKRLESFYKGADDYVKKPIFPSELFLRINRFAVSKPFVKLSHINNSLLYTNHELNLLNLLLDSKGTPLSAEAIISSLGMTLGALYTLISRINKKCVERYQIKSAYGRGWYIVIKNEDKVL